MRSLKQFSFIWKSERLTFVHLDGASLGLTPGLNSLLEASQFVETIEARQGTKIACIEEIAFNNGWMTIDEVFEKVSAAPKNCYSNYLRSVALLGASHEVGNIATPLFEETA